MTVNNGLYIGLQSKRAIYTGGRPVGRDHILRMTEPDSLTYKVPFDISVFICTRMTQIMRRLYYCVIVWYLLFQIWSLGKLTFT